MEQYAKNRPEGWLIETLEEVPAILEPTLGKFATLNMFLNMFAGGEKIRLAVAEDDLGNKEENITKEIKQEYDLGILVQLPWLREWTEINIYEEKLDKNLTQKQLAFRERLEIKTTLNILVPKAAEGILPTSSELYEVLEEAAEDLLKMPETTVVWD